MTDIDKGKNKLIRFVEDKSFVDLSDLNFWSRLLNINVFDLELFLPFFFFFPSFEGVVPVPRKYEIMPLPAMNLVGV